MTKIENINRAEALRYMGYKKGMEISGMGPLIDKCEEELINTIIPRYCFRIFEIEPYHRFVRLINCSLELKGKDISAHLKDCGKAIVLAATLSSHTDKLINKYKISDMTSAFILDCLASAAIEQICDIAEKEILASVGTDNATWRFSPGYGDLPIEQQRDIINCLNAEKLIGLTVTDSNILIPRKSVTAVIGVSEKEIPKGKKGCSICSMSDTCQYRKRGEHCGA